ncbi:hypothetical protein CC1G_14303 [Coprinopsis cinerea okayama7|uniref:Integrase core domain-containing protein n=1 Tax=Coprinopsis cinerea (strain Okayama-7 / 130 / ATCC MYA-4618 / FGSC 9003) TaxID=240176 RepID=D6RLS9_COPC7|nr:hypothetical protein CC1G_14303 [Coprinopsis cinerea okayama7\|eukprot:XP_002911772.1 hypothetical protein CC1G_14303 [Coprinopsis cinerea okayama7\
MSHNRNPEGRNQFPPVPKASDKWFADILRAYHMAGISSNKHIQRRLSVEHGINMHINTVKKRRNELKLYGSRSKQVTWTFEEVQHLVLQILETDPTKSHGKSTVQDLIAFRFQKHIPRHLITDVMHIHDPEGFVYRSPNSKRIYRFKKVPVGIHERWAADGHDKLSRIGFPVYAFVDDATGRWLAAWVVPNNRLNNVIGYLFLLLVEKYKGLPLQLSMDCGSETTQTFGLANALREIFVPEIPVDELPAVRYMRSVHNISIERAWLRLRLDWGNNAHSVYTKGLEENVFNTTDAFQVALVRWLWSRMLQRTLDEFCTFRNGAKMRKDKDKAGPSGCSRDEAFIFYEEWGGQNLLQPLEDDQLEVVRDLQRAMGGEDLLKFVEDELAAQFEDALANQLGLTIADVSTANVWDVFRALRVALTPLD